MDKISNLGGKATLVTTSTALLNQKLGISPASLTLTPYEIKLLRQSKQEIQNALMKKKAA